ncbi:MAG: hypothetical protein WC586_04045 [Methanoregula sp.]
MGKICKDCGKSLGFFSIFSTVERCEDCEKKFQSEQMVRANEINELKGQLISSKEISASQLELLKQQKKEFLIKYYQEILQGLTADKELSKQEFAFLDKLQEGLNLTREETKFDDLILPYLYVLSIRQDNDLPVFNEMNFDDGSRVILKKGEKIHLGGFSIVKEMRTTSHTYEGGSQGMSFRIMKGVSYRVGATRGQIKPVQSLVETSRGAFIITNKRILLHPAPNNKPMDIPINKIASFRCYSNGLELYKEGREKGFLFSLSPGQSECAGIALNFLINKLE